MKRLFLSVLVVTMAIVNVAATKRALIIGIGDYPEVSGWAKINGDKDVPVVEDMLLCNGFGKHNIEELVNEQATREGIITAISHLTTQTQSGDIVYVHFSGHGQQITDIDGDEEDGLDEAWIPYDARAVYQERIYEGENHILDDELFVWFSDIKRKIGEQGNLIVVADACHSGDGSRGDNDEGECIRGSFISDLADASLIFVKKIMSGSKSEQRVQSIPQGDIDWVFISACKDYQSNQEYKKAGSLTAAMAALKTELTILTYDELRLRLKSWMSAHLPRTQTPTMDKPSKTDKTTLW